MSEQIEKMEQENILLKRQAKEQQGQIVRQDTKLNTIIEEAEHYKNRLIKELSKYFPIHKQKEQPKQNIAVQQIQQHEQQAKKSKSLSRSI